MNKYFIPFFVFISLYMVSSSGVAQYCYNTLSLNYDPTIMEQVGDFIYRGTDDNGRRTGSTNRILLIDIDNVSNKNIQLCGAPQPNDIYQKKCVAIKEYDRKFVMAQVREFDGVNRPCTSRDFVYIDIIDTKYSLTRMANCGGLIFKNISIPFVPIAQFGDVILPAIKDTVVGYSNFPANLESNFPLTITYSKANINYNSYEFVVTNLNTGAVNIYPSSIGESITVPDEDMTVELRIKGIDGILNYKVRFYKTTLRRTLNITACDKYSFYGTTYSNSGTYTYTMQNAGKCDSVITLTLKINKPSTSSTNISNCNANFTLNGQTYTSSGSYQQTIKNYLGCDSVITLNLKLNKSTASTVNISTCNANYTLNAQTYTSSGSYQQTVKNYLGCDSVITLNLKLNSTSSFTLNKKTCELTYVLNGQTYTTSGTYKQSLKSKEGCDSTLTLNLTFGNGSNSTINRTACDASYTFNGQTYTESGTYKQTLKNSGGCDSIVTLNLSFQKLNTEVKLSPTSFTSQEVNAMYKWFNCESPNVALESASQQTYIPSKPGKYGVIINKYGCTGNSACFNYQSMVGVDENDGYFSNMTFGPNPTNGKLDIKFNKVETDFTITIISSLGVRISKVYYGIADNVNLDLIDQPSGIYYVIFQNNKGNNSSKKIMRE